MKTKKTSFRIGLLGLMLVLIFVLYGVRLMQLQIVEGQSFRDEADKRATRDIKVKAARGEIVDRYGVPLAVNRTGYNVIFDRVYLSRGKENETILLMAEILKQQGEEWNDSLPVSSGYAPFKLLPDRDSDIALVKKRLGLQSFATFENIWDAMMERYDISTELTKEEARIIAGVRYEMERRGFSVTVPYTFAQDVSMTTVVKIKEKSMEYKGVDIYEEAIREYVNGAIAPHIIGQIGPIYAEEYETLKSQGYQLNDLVGKSGIEKAFEKELKGKDGVNTIEFNSRGDVVGVKVKSDPVPGNTIMLTIDSRLQKVAQDSLEKRIAEIAANNKPGKGAEANAGAAVAVDPTTGEILTIATYPSYNLSTYSKDYQTLISNKLRPLFNRALNGAYAPGSTFKPCMGVAAISSGLMTASSTVYCGHIYHYLEMEFQCMGRHLNTNLLNALRVSCNIYFYDVGKRLGINTINKYAAMFGMGQKTGVELYENIGQLASPELRTKNGGKWYPGDVLQASIGQSDSRFSPLQLAIYTGTVGNNGIRMEAHLVKSIKSYNFEKTILEKKPTIAAKIENSQAAFDAVKQGMLLVSKQGTGRAAFGKYAIDVGTKTGSPENAGKAPNAIFTAFGPVEDCKLAVAAVVELGFNGNKASWIARDIFDDYFFRKEQVTSPNQEGTLLP